MDLEIQLIAPGDDKTYPQAGDVVHIHYVGTLDDGSKFDSSRDRDEPFVTVIGMGRVIKGWDEAIPKLSLGEKANLIIPSSLAYGAQGLGHVIPPHATLKFEVELLNIESRT